jgi:hypothetical protein
VEDYIKWDEVTGFHKEDHYTQIKKTEICRACSTYGRGAAYRVLVVKPEGRRPLGRPCRRWEDNIKVDLREMRWGLGLDRSGSGSGHVVGCCECCIEFSGSIKFAEFLE